MQVKTTEKFDFIGLSLQDMESVSAKIIEKLGKIKVILFYGEMGAGKTTLIKYLSRALGALSDVSSPTFSIVNEYTIQADKKIYHFDFYRIHKESEALDIGWEEYLYSGQYCFIEWAERIPSLLPAAYISLHIQVNADESRTITMVVHEG